MPFFLETRSFLVTDELLCFSSCQRLYKDLLTPMEEWTGLKLKPTACYGARNYFRGSVLANHVDRIDTHVVSAIINIAQVRSRHL